MRKMLSAIFTFSMLFVLAAPAIAAEDNGLTYDERVQALKSDYGITYGVGQYDEQYIINSETQAAALDATEYALQRIGPSAMQTIASPFSSFSIKYGIVVNNGYPMNGVYNSGTVNFTARNPTLFAAQSNVATDSYNSQDPNSTGAKTAMAYAILHEIGHAYDIDYLGYGGTNAMKPYIQNYGYTLSDKNVPYTVGEATEDFAITFSCMLISEKPFVEWWYPNQSGSRTYLTKSDLVYKQCETVYELMLRDFGAGSAAVKRAAIFLGKELPE